VEVEKQQQGESLMELVQSRLESLNVMSDKERQMFWNSAAASSRPQQKPKQMQQQKQQRQSKNIMRESLHGRAKAASATAIEERVGCVSWVGGRL